jgi:hypothetical protein
MLVEWHKGASSDVRNIRMKGACLRQIDMTLREAVYVGSGLHR